MKNDIAGCANLEPGHDQYEKFQLGRIGTVFQYDYRHTDGELFSTVAPKLKTCKQRRDIWLAKKDGVSWEAVSAHERETNEILWALKLS